MPVDKGQLGGLSTVDELTLKSYQLMMALTLNPDWLNLLGLLSRSHGKWRCQFVNSTMPISELEFMPGLDVLKLFKNEEYTVKVFQMLFKYYLYNKNLVLEEKLMKELKVSEIISSNKFMICLVTNM